MHEEVEERVHTIKGDEHFAALPIGRHAEGAQVGTYLVAVLVGCPVCGRSAHNATLPVAYRYTVLEDNGLVHIDGSTILLCTILLQTNDVP